MSHTPRTERFVAAIETDKKDIWEALKLLAEWGRSLERECASLEARINQPEEMRIHVSCPQCSWEFSVDCSNAARSEE